MLAKDVNEVLTQSDRGEPLGELLRRYWQPVGLSSEITAGGKPKQVRVMGEDLVLFRGEDGIPALLGLHCSHRLTSLAYGRVEDGGIRCTFHGWVYDAKGHCLEQPAEPEGSTYKDRVKHPAYPCQEMGGLVFAYMGPEDKKPLLPRYEVLVREDGTRMANYYDINSNYLQNVEGALDTVHFSYLHMDNWSKVKHQLAALPKPTIAFDEMEYGIWQKSHLPNVTEGVVDLVYTYFFMPAGFMRVQETQHGHGDVKKFQSWYVPIDDTHTRRFQVAFAPLGTHGEPFVWPKETGYDQPGPWNDYFRDYEGVDTLSGIPVNAPGTNVKGFLTQDNMVNESQGPVVDRTKEHLGALDHVLTAMRRMYLEAIEDLQNGHDPKHIIRSAANNSIVYIRGTEAMELV